MRLLLDESVPRRLGASFPELFTVHTVQEMGWAGTENGQLLVLAAGQQLTNRNTRSGKLVLLLAALDVLAGLA